MNVLVCGAAGWVGRAVLANLQGRHRVRAFDRSCDAWECVKDLDGPPPTSMDIIHGDIVDFDAVDQVISGVDAIIHLAAHFPSKKSEENQDDQASFLVNLKGLWNVLESARRHQVSRVVHVGSCHVVHPQGVFYDGGIRRQDGTLYAVCKRLQEEMCRQYYDAFQSSIIVLRPCTIVDARLGVDRWKRKLGSQGLQYESGWVCRHDLAEACRLAIEHEHIDFEVLHVVGTKEAGKLCNVARTCELLGLKIQGDLARYR
ncbi:MAG: hypothetical protein CMJ20_05150 [Phycisphaeraceae bacterium]|nr:hypothetical protein [Phycisphaeraceae bacterium]